LPLPGCRCYGHLLDAGVDPLAALLPARHPRRRVGPAGDRGTGPRRPHRIRCGRVLLGGAEGVVWRWRQALGVTRTNNEGTRRLVQAAAEAGGEALRYRGVSDEQCEQRSRTAVRLNLKRFLRLGYHGPRWTQKQLRLLGKEPDDVVAGKVGRSVNAVR